MNWLTGSFRDIYWSLRHILGFWSFVILKVVIKGLRFILVIALAQGFFYLVAYLLDLAGQASFDLSNYFPQTFLRVLATASALIFGYLLFHEPARQYFIIKKEVERQYWNDVVISLRKYPTGHRFHGIVILIRNFKSHPITNALAAVTHMEQTGVPQKNGPLSHALPQARDRAYVWEKAEVAAKGGEVEFALVNLADESETYGNIPSDGKTHEGQDFIEIKGENGDGLIRVEFNGHAGDMLMKPKIVEYRIGWKDEKLVMKTQTRLATWFRKHFPPFY